MTVKPRKKKLFGSLFSPHEQPLTMIGEGISVVGTLHFGEGVVRLDGQLEGKIFGQGTLIVGEKGSLEGELQVGTLILNGRVKGKVTAGTATHITATGRLFGKVHSNQLIIDQGAVFDGEGKTLSAEEPQPPPGG